MRLTLALALSLAPLVACTVGSEQVGDDDVTPTPGELSGAITADRALSGTVTLTADATIAAGVAVTIAAGTHARIDFPDADPDQRHRLVVGTATETG